MPDNTQHTIHTDTALIREWQQSGNYNYLEEVLEMDSTLSETYAPTISTTTTHVSFSIPPMAIWFFIIAIAVILLSLAIKFRLFRNLFKKKDKKNKDVEKSRKEEKEETNEPTEEDSLNQEEIFGFNFEELIANALANQDYANALKYTYMQAFRRLCEAEVITWRKDTTPSEYAESVADEATEPFMRLTTAYIRTQYGHYDIRETDYSHARADFEEVDDHANNIIAERLRKEQEEEAKKAATQKGGEA